MTQISLVVMLAVTVEALVEYGKSIVCSSGGWRTIVIQVAAMVTAILLCLLADADIFAALGISLGEVGGNVLTGVVIARGSNYLADFICRLTAAKQG